MISYTRSSYDFTDFGRVSYGLYSKSEDLLEEFRQECESLLEIYSEKLDFFVPVKLFICKRYFHQYGYVETDSYYYPLVLQIAVKHGDIEVIRFLRNNYPRKSPLSSELTYLAAREGHIEVLKVLTDGSLGEKCKMSDNMANAAAYKGHVELLELLLNGTFGKRFELSSSLIAWAAMGGHLELIKSLRRGFFGGVCQWDETAPASALYGGKREVFQALRNGSLGEKCPWNKEECIWTAVDDLYIQDLIEAGEFD